MNDLNQNVNQIVVIKDKALEIVRSRGPLLPVQITKELGINVMFASALLSELVDKKVLRLSNTKIGGSPVYFVTGQEPKLQALRDKLNDKQQIAFDRLKQQKILRDYEQEPVIRASLRDIKDFAHQLNVTSGNDTEIFWKWYLVPDAEAEPLIRQKLGVMQKKEIPKQNDVQKQLEEIEDNLRKLEEQRQSLRPIEQKVKEEIVKKPSKEKTPRIKKEKIIEPQTQLESKSQIDESDKFMMKVLDYFKQNGILYTEIKQVKKENDFEAEVKIPSAVGSITYFCKAKDKKKLSDSDLSLLSAQAQRKNMPILLITTGELTKKANELLNKEFKNITIKVI